LRDTDERLRIVFDQHFSIVGIPRSASLISILDRHPSINIPRSASFDQHPSISIL